MSVASAPTGSSGEATRTALRSVAFRQQREAQWRELDALTERALRRGLPSLTHAELHRLPVLYRAALFSLSVARRTAMDRALIDYLEGLAARAYLAVYGSRKGTRGALRRALLHEFPRRVRALGPDLALSIAVTILGAVVAWSLMQVDLGWYDAFVEPALAGGRDPNASSESLRAVLYGDGAVAGGGGLSVFASWLFAHNAKIGLMCFALGFAAGIPTLLLLFSNGLMLGAFLALYHDRDMLYELCGWLLPHGIPEVGAVILCGAAGLHVGRALMYPGRLSVPASLARAGRQAALVVLGAVVLFAIAGLIEGIFRQLVTHDGARYALAAFNALWFFGWLTLGGRNRSGRNRDGRIPRTSDLIRPAGKP